MAYPEHIPLSDPLSASVLEVLKHDQAVIDRLRNQLALVMAQRNQATKDLDHAYSCMDKLSQEVQFLDVTRPRAPLGSQFVVPPKPPEKSSLMQRIKAVFRP